MKNYFADVRIEHKGLGRFPIRWGRWNPKSIMFKSNKLVKKIMPEENILSYSTKGDRDGQMHAKTGRLISQTTYNGSPYNYHSRDKYEAVHVQLKHVKEEFIGANIDFIDMRENKDSVGNKLGILDILTYLNSRHNPYEFHRCPKTQQYVKKPNPNVAPLDEGYGLCYGGQGESNFMTMDDWDEYLDICKAIKMFLVDVAVPARNGEFDYDELMVA